jgi:hypothetical protein
MANILPVQHNIKGTLDLDSEYGDVRSGNYVGAENVQFISKQGNESIPKQPFIGNKLLFDKGRVEVQNKRFRLYLSLGDTFSFQVFSANNTQAIGALFSVPSNASYAAYRTAIQGFLTSAGLTSTITIGADHLDIEITSVATYDYQFRVSNASAGVRVIITQESIAQNYTGFLKDIGSYDLNGDLFIFSTPQELLPEEVPVAGIFNPFGITTLVITNTPHGLSSGDEIQITGTDGADGTWMVDQVQSSTSFTLYYSGSVTFANPGVLVKNYTGVGEIGVAQFDEQAETGTYTRLLRSKELGFNTLHQIDCDAEISPLGKSLYFNQYKYNPPRVFYYLGNYVFDGGLTYVNSDNRYEYGNINRETLLIANTQSTKIELVAVEEGGSLPCGNRQYFLRLLTTSDALAGTDFHAFTPNVNIYKPTASSKSAIIHGNNFDVISNKSVRLRISNVDADTYSFYELYVIEKIADAVSFKRIIRQEIISGSFDYVNTGFELVEEISISEIVRQNINLLNVGGLRIVDNRLVMHDITYSGGVDFSDWAKTFTHQIERVRIDGEGGLTSHKFGGYLDPENTFNIVGFTWYETYRIGVRLYLKDGGVTDVYWVDDIKVDDSANNISTPNRRTGTVSSPGISSPSVFDLSDQFGNNYYVPCIRFSNINLNYLSNGKRIIDLIDKFEFMIVDMESNASLKEVLFNGIGVIGYHGSFAQYISGVNGVAVSQVGSVYNDYAYLLSSNTGFYGNVPDVFPFPFVAGQKVLADSTSIPFGLLSLPPFTNMASTTLPNGLSESYKTNIINQFFPNLLWPTGRFIYPPNIYPGSVGYPGFAGAFVPLTKTLFLYSNDCILGKKEYSFSGGDQIINFGKAFTTGYLESQPNGADIPTFTRDFDSHNLTIQPKFIDIIEGFYLPPGESKLVQNHPYPKTGSFGKAQINIQNHCGLEVGSTTTRAFKRYGYEFAPSVVLNLDDVVTETTPGQPSYNNNEDNGAYYISVYRQRAYPSPDQSKFGLRKDSNYISTGQYFEVNSSSGSTFLFSAGDTFISRFYLKYAANLFDTSPDEVSTGAKGGAGTMGYISQSRVNARMRSYNSELLENGAFPTYPLENNGLWGNLKGRDQEEYNVAYNNTKIITARAFDSTNFIDSFPSRVIWSDLKPDGSFFDSYRFFPPGQFNDYSRNYGPVTHIEVLDDEFYVFQPRNFSREYFNTTGTISSDTDELVILGNAGVLSRKGATITSYGSLHKWSCVKGRSASGRDVLYWFNAENGLFLKYGGRGAEPLSMAKGLNQWFNENSKFVYSHNTPAAGRGICGGWNERFQELRYTFRGYKNSPEWGVGKFYDKGDVVIYGGNGFVPVQLYLSRVDHISSPANIPGGNTVTWEAISEKDSRYYNVFTLVYNEMKDGFTSFLSPKPLIYHRWRNNLLTQRYGDWSQYPNYLENFGDYNTWYSSEEGELAEDGFIIPAINYNSDVNKTFSALYVDSEFAPERVEFFTPEHESFLVLSDFESREGMWVSTIKNDILTAPNGINDGDTSRLFGRYLLVKVFFSPKKFQSLRNIRIRLQFNSRYLQT